MDHKHHHNRVHFQRGTLEPHTQRYRLVDPPSIHPIGHDGVQTERSGDRGAFKVLGFAGGVLGYIGGGDVEARETGEATEDEEG